MLARGLTTNLRSAKCGVLRTASFNTSATSLSHFDTDETDKPARATRKLREWQKPPPQDQSSFLGSFQAKPAKGKPFRVLRRPLPTGRGELKQWIQAKAISYAKYNQRFVQERHETLGCDLAAAHFLVHRGGKVKFLGQDEWIERGNDPTLDKLPPKYDPYWQLTHIDASGVELYYEGITNFISLGQVKWASFKGNPHFDDWCLDKVVAQLPKVEHLDVSECKKLTERGLGAVYRLYNLKTLIVTDWDKAPSFELTCIMLEDLNRGLKIDIKEPELGSKDKK